MRSGRPSPVTSPIAVATGTEPPLCTDEERNRGSGAAARAGLAISVVPRTMRQAAIFVRIITAHPGSGEPRRIAVDAIEGIGRRNGRPSG
jgi:hypothetical protein